MNKYQIAVATVFSELENRGINLDDLGGKSVEEIADVLKAEEKKYNESFDAVTGERK